MEEIQAVEQKAVAILDQALALMVTNEAEYVEVGEFIVSCKALAAEIKAFFKPMKDKAFAAHRAICDQETNTLNPVNQAIKAAGDAALPWKKEQDRIAQEKANREYQEKLKAMQEAKLKEAQVLEAFGEPEAADKVLDEAKYFEPRRGKVESTVPKVAGLSTRKTWKGRIVKPHEVNRPFCMPDQTLVNMRIKSFFAYNPRATPEEIKALEVEIGGVEVYLDEGFAGAARARS
jgi:hypothetical protein